jgi:hypothetical protein
MWGINENTPVFANYSVKPKSTELTGGWWNGVPGSYYEDPRKVTAGVAAIPTLPSAATGYDPAALQDLAKQTNAFNLAEQTGQYEAGIPNYTGLAAKSSENIGAQLRGEVPEDVVNLIGQQAAERGITRGVPGSQFANYDYLRALGLTSLGQQAAGEGALTNAVSRMPKTPLMNIASMYITPQQQREYELAQGQQDIGWYNAESSRINAINRGVTGGGGGATRGGMTTDDIQAMLDATIKKYSNKNTTSGQSATLPITTPAPLALPQPAATGGTSAPDWLSSGLQPQSNWTAPDLIGDWGGYSNDYSVVPSNAYSYSNDDSAYYDWYYGG